MTSIFVILLLVILIAALGLLFLRSQRESQALSVENARLQAEVEHERQRGASVTEARRSDEARLQATLENLANRIVEERGTALSEQHQERFTTASAARLGELRTFLARLDGAAVELEQLADSSGGQFWLPPSHSEVVAAAPRLAGEIGAQYSLAFITERRPTLEDRRRLEVIPARPGLSLRSRRSHIVLPVAEGRSEAKP